MEKVTLNLVKNEQDKSWECQILVNDDKLIGKKATLDIDIIIDVKQSGGHDAHISIYNSSFILQNKSVLQTFSSKKLDRKKYFRTPILKTLHTRYGCPKLP